MTDDAEFLSALDADLRAGKDRTDAIDDLFQMTFGADDATLGSITWCLAKMAQNKVADMRIHGILMSVESEDPDVKENVLWGLGELSGRGIGDENSLGLIKRSMTDPASSVRAMAAWAAGRYMHKLSLEDEESRKLLKDLENDRSELVKTSAKFAFEDKD